jgi:hypothetical protein
LRAFAFLLVVILVAVGYFWGALSWNYSTGERAGWVQKFSKKGWLCKTWEGEMTMITMPGAVAEKFTFTVWDDKVAETVNNFMGKRVALHYEEKVGLPTTCFGDTRYYVTKITPVEDTPSMPGASVPVPPPAPSEPATAK